MNSSGGNIAAEVDLSSCAEGGGVESTQTSFLKCRLSL